MESGEISWFAVRATETEVFPLKTNFKKLIAFDFLWCKVFFMTYHSPGDQLREAELTRSWPSRLQALRWNGFFFLVSMRELQEQFISVVHLLAVPPPTRLKKKNHATVKNDFSVVEMEEEISVPPDVKQPDFPWNYCSHQLFF